ncbi:MAG: peptidylprolyl isomerase [Lachnospiraceae bacterium]|nr:peptidylprolyl isomerase [Lachnospiraceae bacterium]
MKNKMIKTAGAVMAAVMLLTGCSIGGKNIRLTTGLSESVLFKIDGSPFSVSEAMLYLTTEKNLYEQSFGTDIWDKKIGDVTFEEYVKNSVKNQLAEIKILNLLAKDKKIKLSEEEKAKAVSDAEIYFQTLTDAEKEYMNVKQETVSDAYMEYRLADKVYEELVKDINPEISDAEAKVIKVASIYAKTYTLDDKGNRVEYTDEEKAKSKEDIEELLTEINNGGDFMTIAANNTDANQVEYQFGKGEMIQEFEDAAYLLKTDETSGIIETPDGYYIIKCISDYLADETQEHKAEMIQDKKNEAFKEIYNPFVEKLSSEFNDNVWKKISFGEMGEVKVSNFYQCISE